ncbi:hypothetical protein KEM54_001437 [Ascosphaera aggregata]|nr:hypothetical protein KEM54_001437 [Ascosphaera aggregata]
MVRERTFSFPILAPFEPSPEDKPHELAPSRAEYLYAAPFRGKIVVPIIIQYNNSPSVVSVPAPQKKKTMGKLNIFGLKSRESVARLQNNHARYSPARAHGALEVPRTRRVKATLSKVLKKLNSALRILMATDPAVKPVSEPSQTDECQDELNELDDEALWKTSPFSMKKRAEQREVSPMILPAASFPESGPEKASDKI